MGFHGGGWGDLHMVPLPRKFVLPGYFGENEFINHFKLVRVHTDMDNSKQQ
jgi:hypothetical protein